MAVQFADETVEISASAELYNRAHQSTNGTTKHDDEDESDEDKATNDGEEMSYYEDDDDDDGLVADASSPRSLEAASRIRHLSINEAHKARRRLRFDTDDDEHGRERQRMQSPPPPGVTVDISELELEDESGAPSPPPPVPHIDENSDQHAQMNEIVQEESEAFIKRKTPFEREILSEKRKMQIRYYKNREQRDARNKRRLNRDIQRSNGSGGKYMGPSENGVDKHSNRRQRVRFAV